MSLVDWLFPKRCVGCKRWGSYFCPECQTNIIQSDLVCPSCERASIGGRAHPLCKKKWGLDGLWSLGVYQDPLRKGVQELKYRLVRDINETLVNIIVEYWARYSPEFFEEIKKDPDSWVVVPVPLHPKRERWRGFNQSAEIGKVLASKMGLKYGEYLKRVRFTKPQVGLKGKARYLNTKGAFALTSRFTLPANILLIDDVWTTGSTLKECGNTLKRAGVNKVWAITLAR
jgi:competence protein ComFC